LDREVTSTTTPPENASPTRETRGIDANRLTASRETIVVLFLA